MTLPFERLSLLPLAFGLAVLLWDILLAGWIASQQQSPRVFTTLTGICGLLVAPAALISMANVLDASARTTSAIAWIWPVVTVCFAMQVAYALFARLLTPAVGLPLLLYNVCVATVSIGDFVVGLTGAAPVWLQGAVAARDAIIGMTAGRTALASPIALMIPMIAPAHPARWKVSAGVRVLLTIAATALTTLLLVEWPRGVGAVRSFGAATGVRLQERPEGDFAIGLRLFGTLSGPPPARLIAADTKLSDTLRAATVLVVVNEKGTRAAALDSLSRVLEPWRADSATIAIAIEFDASSGLPLTSARESAVERVLLHVKPDVLLPGWRRAMPSLLASGEPTLQWWQSMLTRTADIIQRVRPRTTLGWVAARVDARDSAVFDWASRTSSPVKLLGIISFPSFAGLPAVDARLRAFEHWHTLSQLRYQTPCEFWLMEVGGLPRAHGDAGQTAAIMRALAWSTRQPWVTTAIIGDAGDYEGAIGLRAANGRLRGAVGVVSRASRGLNEASAATMMARPAGR
ncbi:MAG: hypothetical protein M3Y64_11595 [Gemmatimonadota bacterium]|nr:hypothetical protein [Gemmatimonadota bacterium]